MGKKNVLENPIIFIGTGRTGSTIISRIICEHPDLAYISNYQKHFVKYPVINLVGLLFSSNIFKKRYLNKMHFRPEEAYAVWKYLTGEDVDFAKSFLLTEKLSKERIDFIRDYFLKVIRYQCKRRLAFKITGPPRIAFLRQIFPDALFIYVRRNYVPTIHSFLNVKYWNTDTVWWSGAYSDKEKEMIERNKKDPVFLTSIQIKKVQEVFEKEIKECNPKLMEVSYEDFVSTPQKTIGRILSFAGLEKRSSPCFDYIQTHKIDNRNKRDSEYFSVEELGKINKIFNNTQNQ